MKVVDLLGSIDNGTMALPEFQRGYVWSRDQVRGLMQSLYREYPVGSLLVWQTTADATKLKGDQPPFGNVVELLLDGQQRITSLYGVMRGIAPPFFQGNEKAFRDLWFNVEDEVFQFYGPIKMKGDPTWIDVTALYRDGFGTSFGALGAAGVAAERMNVYAERLQRLLAIGNRDFHKEQIVGGGLDLDDVVDIFNRVNSGGTKLSKGDLALARICAEWPEARSQMLDRIAGWQAVGFGFKLDWFLRITNAVATGSASFESLESVKPAELSQSLETSGKAVDTLLNLVASRLGLDHDRVLGGRYAFVVMARYLTLHQGKLTNEEQQRLLFWYVEALIWGRHSGSTESTLQQDLDAVAKGGLDELIGLMELWRGDLRVRPEHFAGAERGSRFYPLLYLLTRVGGGQDLHTGVELKQNLLGKLSSLELHHIFPRAVLRKNGFQRAQRNALGNFCFLTKESNISISAKDPAAYLAEVAKAQPDALRSQWIPEDPDLWKIANYAKFLEVRRELLAEAANDLLSSLRSGGSSVPEESSEKVVARVEVNDDEPLLSALERFVEGVGLASPELHFEIVDEDGAVVAQVDAAWPNGLQEGLTEKVAFLLEPDAESESRLGKLGYRFFIDRVSFDHYVESLVGLDLDGDGVIGEPEYVDRSSGAVVEHLGKYRPLWEFLVGLSGDDRRMSFNEVEAVLGFPLPPSSRDHPAHWSSYQGSAVVRAVHDAGWRATEVDLTAESVRFRRTP